MSSEKDIQTFILKGLFENKSYFRNVSTNLDPDYFDEDKSPLVSFVRNYFTKYEKIPEYSTALNVMMNTSKYPSELKEEIEHAISEIRHLKFDVVKEGEWLFDETKKFANNRAMFNVLKDGAMEISKEQNGGEGDYAKIEKDMREALAMDWNDDLGIDFFDEDEIDGIYDSLCDDSIRIPIGVDVIDDAINGGIPGKSKFCMVYVGSAGIGKCVSYINTINIRNKTTGEVVTLPIGEFHDSIKEKYNEHEEGKSS
jgi:hypothetical protein